MRRSGIAMLLTLFFISALMVLVAGYIRLTDVFPRSGHYYQNIAEDGMLLKELMKILGRYKIKNSAQLDYLLIETPMIGNEDGSFMVSFEVDNPQSRININLAATKSAGKFLSTIIFRLASQYQVTDPQLLLNLIKDSIDPDMLERQHGSEISLIDGRFQSGPIGSYRRFSYILERYYELSGDENVYHIPWRDVFTFSDRLDLIFDCERATPEAKRALDVEEESDLCALAQTAQFKAIAKALSIQKFSKKKSYIIHVQARYVVDQHVRDLRLQYDVVKGRVERID